MTLIHEHDGQDFWAKFICKVLDCDAQDHQPIKILLALSDGELEEMISYNELSDLVSAQQTANQAGYTDLLGFHLISDHQGHLKK